MSAPTIVIVGRPNVGKSTLFNRIVGGRAAIVDAKPGSTRDRHFARAEWAGRGFWLVDTGGFVPSSQDPMESAIRSQVEMALSAADLVVFVVDVTLGPHPGDQEIAEALRVGGRPVVLAANKADRLPEEAGHLAFYELGVGDPIPVSASTGRGSGDLLDLMAAALPQAPPPPAENEIAVAVIGRPNVGKSSLVNRLLGEERVLVRPEPGTTRDAIDTPLRYHGRVLNFVDTAGLRRRGPISEAVEFYASLRTARAIERADVCVVVVDASSGLQAQDIRVARRVWDQGAALVIAVNKWDLVSKDTNTAVEGERRAVTRASFLGDVPFVYLSALTGLRTGKVLEAVMSVADARLQRVRTAEVNRALREIVAERQPPQAGGAEVKLLYGAQIGVAPPTFAVVSTRPEAIPDAYQRFLVSGIRRRFGLHGTPIRVRLRARKRSRAR